MSEPHRLDVRARHLLRTLIAQYLEEGQPVGSRTLARSAGLDVSPATVRNITSVAAQSGALTPLIRAQYWQNSGVRYQATESWATVISVQCCPVCASHLSTNQCTRWDAGMFGAWASMA